MIIIMHKCYMLLWRADDTATRRICDKCYMSVYKILCILYDIILSRLTCYFIIIIIFFFFLIFWYYIYTYIYRFFYYYSGAFVCGSEAFVCIFCVFTFTTNADEKVWEDEGRERKWEERMNAINPLGTLALYMCMHFRHLSGACEWERGSEIGRNCKYFHHE